MDLQILAKALPVSCSTTHSTSSARALPPTRLPDPPRPCTLPRTVPGPPTPRGPKEPVADTLSSWRIKRVTNRVFQESDSGGTFGRKVSFSGLFRSRFRVCLGVDCGASSCLNRVLFTSCAESLSGPFRVLVGSFSGRFRVLFGSFPGQLGKHTGSFSGRFRVLFGSFSEKDLKRT